MKCRRMQHFIWVFTVCLSPCLYAFPVYRGLNFLLTKTAKDEDPDQTVSFKKSDLCLHFVPMPFLTDHTYQFYQLFLFFFFSFIFYIFFHHYSPSQLEIQQEAKLLCMLSHHYSPSQLEIQQEAKLLIMLSHHNSPSQLEIQQEAKLFIMLSHHNSPSQLEIQ